MRKLLIRILILVVCLSALSFSLSCKNTSGYSLNCYVDGRLYKSVDVLKDGQAQMPLEPVKAGYQFVGWCLDNGSFENNFEQSDLVGISKDLSVYAKFEPLFMHENGVITGLTPFGKANLSVVEVPENIAGQTITEISKDAFVSCSLITSVTLPSTITKIGEGTFSGCSSLVSLDVDDLNQVYHAFGNCIIETDKLLVVAGCKTSQIPTYVLEIGSFAFKNTQFSSVQIPKSVAKIGEGAFYGCTSLLCVSFEQQSWLTEIGNKAFDGCSNLQDVTLPVGVTNIGERAFAECKKLEQFSVPSTVTQIGAEAFIDCEKLATFTFESSSKLLSLGKRAFFGCVALSSFELPKDVAEIQTDTFFGCKNLKTFTFAQDSIVKTVGDWAFYGCISLESISLPSTILTIKQHAFADCTALSTIEFDGASTRFAEIGFGNNWHLNVPATHVKCGDANFELV